MPEAISIQAKGIKQRTVIDDCNQPYKQMYYRENLWINWQ